MQVFVFFGNSYPGRVPVAYMAYDPDRCGDAGDWATHGWWNIDPSQEVYVFTTYHRYMAFYAEASDGAFWAGDIAPVYFSYVRFNGCYPGAGSVAGSEIVRVGMRLIDLGPEAADPIVLRPYTITLIP